jgi:hypothetical protein
MPGKSVLLLRPALVVGLFSLALSSASAQGYSPYAYDAGYSSGPNESVTVMAPRFREDRTPLNGPMERISLSKPIHYST